MQFDQINILKGLAIILVVVGHFYPLHYSDSFWTHLNEIIYSFHMALFMSISGFLYANSSFQVNSLSSYVFFIKKKSIRLILPYLSISLIIITAKLIAEQIVTLKYPVDLDAILYQLLLSPMGGPTTFLWFIYTLLIIFLFYPLVALLVRSRLILLLLSFTLTFVDLPTVFSLNLFGEYLFYFVIGINIFYYRSVLFKKHIIIVIAILGLLSIYILTNYQTPDIIRTLTGITLMWILSLFLSLNYNMKYIMKIGIYSPAIYLFHTFTMGPIRIVLEKYFDYNTLSFYTIMLITVFAGVFIPILIAEQINKNKKIRLILLGN